MPAPRPKSTAARKLPPLPARVRTVRLELDIEPDDEYELLEWGAARNTGGNVDEFVLELITDVADKIADGIRARGPGGYFAEARAAGLSGVRRNARPATVRPKLIARNFPKEDTHHATEPDLE